jgi:hypothetical protein
MADKYDFIQALKLVSRDWLRCENVVDGKKLWELAMASAWLKNEGCFEESTKALLYHHAGSYVGLGETEMMPLDIVGRFEVRNKSGADALPTPSPHNPHKVGPITEDPASLDPALGPGSAGPEDNHSWRTRSRWTRLRVLEPRVSRVPLS